MAEPTWGQLKKAQDDDTTIDQAIAAAIATHEADPDAHTGAGESLETHKSQEVVDHPAGSILGDKITSKELMVFTGFDSLDGWTTFGNVSLEGFSFVEIRETQGETNLSRLYSQFLADTDFFKTTQDAVIQSVFYINNPQYEKFFLIFGGYISDSEISGFGFRIIDNEVKGFFGFGTNINYSADLSINPALIHVYRAEYVATTEQVKFYIDGVLKATLNKPTGWDAISEPYIEFRAGYNEEGADYYVRVYNFYLSKEI